MLCRNRIAYGMHNLSSKSMHVEALLVVDSSQLKPMDLSQRLGFFAD